MFGGYFFKIIIYNNNFSDPLSCRGSASTLTVAPVSCPDSVLFNRADRLSTI